MHTVDLDLLWIIFIVAITTMLLIDLWQQKQHTATEMTLKQAAYWSLAWIIVALCFNLVMGLLLYVQSGSVIAIDYSVNFLSGYLVEKSLAIDNVFVWLLIFNRFAIPLHQQKRVLFYGVLGAIVLRVVMILMTAVLIEKFHAILYLFGVFLLFMGIKSFKEQKKEQLVESRYFLKFKSFFYIASDESKNAFWIKNNGKWVPTLLLLVLILIELSDIVFAIDSIPAVFAITTNTFIVISSNLFAILGLRSLYFLISIAMKKYDFFRYAVAALLIFVGFKILCGGFIPISAVTSLLIIILIFAVCYLIERFWIKKG